MISTTVRETRPETTAETIARLTAERDEAGRLGMQVLAGQLDQDLRDLAIVAFGGAK